MSVASMLRGVNGFTKWVTAEGLREKALELDVGREMQRQLISSYDRCHKSSMRLMNQLRREPYQAQTSDSQADAGIRVIYDPNNKIAKALDVLDAQIARYVGKLQERPSSLWQQSIWQDSFFPKIDRSEIIEEIELSKSACVTYSVHFDKLHDALKNYGGADIIDAKGVASAWVNYRRTAAMRQIGVGVLGGGAITASGFGLYQYLTSDKA